MCLYDQGNEFLGKDFQAMLQKNGVHSAGSTVKTPQSNTVCKRLHQSIGNTLRVLNFNPPPSSIIGTEERVNSALQTAA